MPGGMKTLTQAIRRCPRRQNDDLTLDIPLETGLWRRDAPAGQTGPAIQGQLSLFT